MSSRTCPSRPGCYFTARASSASAKRSPATAISCLPSLNSAERQPKGATRSSSTNSCSIAGASAPMLRCRTCLGQSLRIEFFGTDSRRPEALLALFNADASKLSEDEIRAMIHAREQLPKAIEQMDLSPEDRAALRQALGRKKKKEPGDKEHPPVFAEFRIVGVFRDRDKKRDADMLDFFNEGLSGDVAISRNARNNCSLSCPFARIAATTVQPSLLTRTKASSGYANA